MSRVLLIALLAASGLIAQAPAAEPNARFEDVTITPSVPHPSGPVRVGGDGYSGGRVIYANTSLRNLVSRAFGVQADQISGPAWLDTERFDVRAKLPNAASRNQEPALLQMLLIDHFKFTGHTAQKEVPIYALVVAKSGLKLREVDPAAHSSSFVRNGQIEANATVARLASLLWPLADRPVLDMTGLKPSYSINLHWAPMPSRNSASNGLLSPDFGSVTDAAHADPVRRTELPEVRNAASFPEQNVDFPASTSRPSRTNPAGGGPSLFAAIQSQLGLKMESRKAWVDVVVIDHIEKRPTQD